MSSSNNNPSQQIDEQNRQGLLLITQQLLVAVAELQRLANPSSDTMQQKDANKLKYSVEQLSHFLEQQWGVGDDQASGTSHRLHELRNLAGVISPKVPLVASRWP